MKDIMDLNVYTEALEFSNKIWTFCKQFDYFAQQTIGIQLVKSADSISANIAEGFGRFHYKENLNFCYFARGSVEETKDWLKKLFIANLYLMIILKKLTKKSR
jgi:four helix bundle protein